MDIKTANTLYESGILKEMYKSGFVSNKIFFYREIYLWVDLQMKTRGISRNQAVLEAEVKFSRDERTIWTAVKSFFEN